MTCEKCYHNEVCKALYELNGIPRIGTTECAYFRDKDHLLDLPCAVGDMVYMPWEWKDTSGIAILTVERISITEAGQSIRTDLWSDDEDYWLAYNCGVFYFDDIGKTVFFTREAAEAALEARNAKP